MQITPSQAFGRHVLRCSMQHVCVRTLWNPMRYYTTATANGQPKHPFLVGLPIDDVERMDFALH